MIVLPDLVRAGDVSATVTALGASVLISICGDLDLATVGAVEDVVDAAVRARPACLVLDLAGVTFCGVRGLALVIRTAEVAAGLGVRLSVCGASVQATRLWPLLWATAVQPVCFSDVSAAVA